MDRRKGEESDKEGRAKKKQEEVSSNNNSSNNRANFKKISSSKQQVNNNTDPIQSIANVLTEHSKFVQNKKKSLHLEEHQAKNKLDQPGSGAIALDSKHLLKHQATGNNILSQPQNVKAASSSLLTCSHANQVDQESSYLYAYNDFVTSGGATREISPKVAGEEENRSTLNLERELVNSCTHILSLPADFIHHQQPHHHQFSRGKQEESLLESDEDDALSYILHQQRPNALQTKRCNNVNLNSIHSKQPNSNRNCLIQEFEESLNTFGAHQINHHLSCTRVSHPRHICGIGGSQNDNLNSIAARLREESQRAFVLNQRHRSNFSEDQLNELSHHLLVPEVYNKQAAAANYPNNNQQNSNLYSLDAKQTYLETGAEVKGSISEGLTDSSSEQSRRPTLLAPHQVTGAKFVQYNHQARIINRKRAGFLSWLFCCLCNVLGNSNKSNLVVNSDRRKRRRQKANESSIINMYTAATQQQLGQLGGQAGAYYASQATDAAGAAAMHPPYHPHPHHHHYPMSSDSSLGSSAFANSALRMNAFFRTCCSKKCLFVSCLMLILLIFIFVIGLSAYLNFLISLNKTNLTPLSGRLKIETQGDTFNDQLSNRTSKEFLAKQQQYETILRGAFDRTQNLLKSYPNHLVKCEVYTFKQGSLWVYFRLFINKRTLLQDNQLMKRKSPDEHLDKQFLPRLTQQTLHSGFEQLMSSSSSRNVPPPVAGSSIVYDSRRSSRSSQTEPLKNLSNSVRKENPNSFDDQISRLMPIIESIDLQSIQITSDFDMLQNSATQQQQQSMSDNLRASQFLTTASSAVMVATGRETGSDKSNKASDNEPNSTTQFTPISSSSSSSSSSSKQSSIWQPTPQSTELSSSGSMDEISVSTKKFTLYGYKENSTRPTTQPEQQQERDSLFLLNHQQRKPSSSRNNNNLQADNSKSQTVKEIASSIASSSDNEKVVKLLSGQPVVSQNNLQRSNQNNFKNTDTEKKNLALNKSNITLFVPLTKLEHSAPIIDLSATASSNKNNGQRVVNETVVAQMIAPYQKTEFSTNNDATVRKLSSMQNPTVASIQDLWNNALGTNTSKKNVTLKNENHHLQPHPKRMITVTTIGISKNQDENQNQNSSDWNNVSLLSSDVSSTIRAQLLNATQASSNLTAIASSSQNPLSPTTTVASSSQKPKVSPHLKHGGSIISATPLRQQESTNTSNSAIVLNRDFQQAASSNNQGQAPVPAQDQQLASSRVLQQQNRSDKQNQASKPSRKANQRNATSSDSSKQRNTKPTIKANKLKKIAENQQANNARNNDTTTSQFQTPLSSNGTLINSKGIRIVDNFLASIDSSLNKNNQNENFTLIATNSRANINRNRTQEQANLNFSDQIVPTLPTTIELTRSTTSSPSSRTTSLNHLQSDTSDSTSTSATSPKSIITTTEFPPPLQSAKLPAPDQSFNILPVSLLGSNPINRPGTSNFSNQWRPMSNVWLNSSETANSSRTNISTRKPNLSIILGAQRLPASLNVGGSNQGGSQSPFAMSPALLQNQVKPLNSFSGRRTSNKLSNTYQVFGNGRSSSNNEFESRRVSRMRQGSGGSDSNVPSETVSSTSTSTTSSSLNLDSNTRLVDDFMITTDRIEGNTRGSTLLPPLVHSSGHDGRVQASSSIMTLPKRTRGPFAFETLKSESILSSLNPLDLSVETSARSERSPPSSNSNNNQGVESKLLIRKKLFVGSDDDLVLANGPSTVSEDDISKVSLSKQDETDITLIERKQDQFGERRLQAADGSSRQQADINSSTTFRCQYYGCKAKGSMKFTCLNYTQLCDDFIDCQDESDELDCVSLLQHDAKTNKLSFSNGGGIIYLNRKGSLAPMCIDYFAGMIHPASLTTNSAHDLEAIKLSMVRKQQELIRQINTIGQYACSLQSFSRLVSVKINHHNLIDNLDLIKSSKLYHKLSIVNQDEKQTERGIDLSSHDSYKSGTSEHEVEISTASDCPSQRTVFVKCGGFECGQDSFSVIDKNNSFVKKGGVIINDFPWLVKLYWHGTLSCHGYLIDDLWLITSSECFANKTQAAQNEIAWTAEISYEHYGNDDYQSIESNFRSIKEILIQPDAAANKNVKSSIVLAKLEKPVRFSPLNRPICLPTPNSNKTKESDTDRIYNECVTATLPLANGGLNSPTQDLALNKVKVHNLRDCFDEGALERFSKDFICVSDLSKYDGNSRISRNDADSTHVLICSTIQASKSRSKWTVVGVQNKVKGLRFDTSKQLFTAVASQIDWIVDTMNPKNNPNLLPGGFINGQDELNTSNNNMSTCNRFRCSSGECLSFSRICDGLYDCSSQDDERDCHK